jgi:hypothetical protein
MDDDPKELAFNDAMLNVYRRAKAECNYNAILYLQMVTDYGGLGAARKLLAAKEVQSGFTELWLKDRLDLTVEFLVLQNQWRSLFTSDELAEARSRLIQHGFREDRIPQPSGEID